MDFDSLSLRAFISELGSATPVPGGGSVAAVCASFAAALAMMVSRLTLAKGTLDDSRDEMTRVCDNARELADRLLILAQEDSDAYMRVIGACRLPAQTAGEKALRKESISGALKAAASVPMETLRASKNLVELAGIVLKKGNLHAITDAGAALHLARTAAVVAAANVRINLPGIDNAVFVLKCRQEMQDCLDRMEAHFSEAVQYLESHLP